MGRYATSWQDDQADTGSSAAVWILEMPEPARTRDCGMMQRSLLSARRAFSALSNSKKRSCSQGISSCCWMCFPAVRFGSVLTPACESSLRAELRMLAQTDCAAMLSRS